MLPTYREPMEQEKVQPLKCLGLVRPDSGEIRILKKQKRSVVKMTEERGTVLSSCFFRIPDSGSANEFYGSNFIRDFRKKEFEKQCSRFQLPVDKKLKEFSTGMKAKLKILFAKASVNARFLILMSPQPDWMLCPGKTILDLLREYMEVPAGGILISSHISSDLGAVL